MKKMNGSKIGVIVTFLALVAFIIGYNVEGNAVISKDSLVKNNTGNISLEIPQGLDVVPLNHSVGDKWKTTHMDIVKSNHLKTENCLTCHDNPEKFCNQCHDYVGVKEITPNTKLANNDTSMDNDDMHNNMPLKEWRINHDNSIINGTVELKNCFNCHEYASAKDNFCNNCHMTLGLRKISIEQDDNVLAKK
jgi:hypothetical protein